MLLWLWVPLCSFIILSLEFQKENAGVALSGLTPPDSTWHHLLPRLSMPGLGALGRSLC